MNAIIDHQVEFQNRAAASSLFSQEELDNVTLEVLNHMRARTGTHPAKTIEEAGPMAGFWRECTCATVYALGKYRLARLPAR